MICQVCQQASAEWKIREYRDGDRNKVIRWWYLCDVCLMESYGPWLPKGRIPALEDNQLWSSAGGGKTFRRAAPTPSSSTTSSTMGPSSEPSSSISA